MTAFPESHPVWVFNLPAIYSFSFACCLVPHVRNCPPAGLLWGEGSIAKATDGFSGWGWGKGRKRFRGRTG